MCLAHWLQIAQLTATAFIGGVAALIAWRQWRTAQDKVKLDLFDRRFSVFMDARKLASEAFQLGRITDPTLPNEVIARGRFLFDDKLHAEIERLQNLCTRLEMKDQSAASDINDWFDQFLKDIKPYMSMGHLKS